MAEAGAHQADVRAAVLEAGGGVGTRQLHDLGLAVHAQRVLVLIHRQRRVERVAVARSARNCASDTMCAQ